MKITYLGTAAAEGIPAIFCACRTCRKAQELGGKNIRTRSQALIDDQLLIDLPPDSYYHFIHNNIRSAEIAALLVTHSHQDHFYPQEFIMRAEPYAHMHKVPVLSVYGNAKVHAFYKMALALQDDSLNIHARVCFHQIKEFETLVIPGRYTVTPVLANHDKTENCFLYLIERNGKTIFYSNDTGYYPEVTWNYLKGRHLDLVSLDCTCVMTKDGHTHMGIPDNIEIKERLYQIGCADDTTKFVITHFSHNYKMQHDEIEEAGKKYGFITAYDGMTVEV